MPPCSTVILGTGSYAPERVVTNDDLAHMVETSDEWIRTRTGIRERRIAAPSESTSDMAVQAARRALADAGLAAADIDLLIVATLTPDMPMPATACFVQPKLGVPTSAACFDLAAACSGFVYALDTACAMVGSGRYRKALVIGVEKLSAVLDWQDRTTCVLFGDGAGAVVVTRTTEVAGPAANGQPPAILSTHLHSDGRYRDILYVDGGPSRTGTVGKLRMSGKEVFRHAVSCLAQAADEAMSKNGLAIADIDWLIPHQANRRILEGVARKLSVPSERVISTVEIHANTSAASIPLALDVAVRDGRITPGDLVLFEAIGGGLTWGSALVRW